jgi:predicted XRE-type DNA-binding protein
MQKDIPRFPNYFVTADGYVWSRSYRGHGELQMLKWGVNHKGYRIVSLSNDLGEQKTITIHRLVAQAFIPNPENLPEVNHRNGNKTHNYYLNLEWITHLKNMQHAERMGLIKHASGERINTCVVTGEMVLKIREIYSRGELTQKEVGNIFGVGQMLVSNIVRRNTWKHI